MSGEMLTGQDAPAVTSEAQTLEPAQTNTGTTEAQTDGAQGGNQSPAPERTFKQSELDEIVAREKAKAAARAERKAFREAAQRLQREPAAEPPKREAFANDETFTRAQLEFLAEQKAEQKLREREAAREAERRQEAFMERAEKASERFPDFHSVVSNPNLRINEAMVEYLAESDLGGELAYHLGKNPEKSAQIADMSPIRAARELARLEAELAKAPATSKAPPPIEPLGSNKSKSDKSPDEMTQAEFNKWRKEQIARRGR